MLNKDYLESLYKELLEEAKHVQTGTVEDERVDAKLCLVEEMLELVEGDRPNKKQGNMVSYQGQALF